MEEISWFEKNRGDMLADIPHQTLHSQTFVDFEYDDLIEIAEILETFNTVEIVSEKEIATAIIAETIYKFDELTIQRMLKETDIEIIRLTKLEPNNMMIGFANIISKTLWAFFKNHNLNINNSFIIVSPMVLCLLQSLAKNMFRKTDEGGFNGPNYTRLVGTINEIKTYSYLLNTEIDIIIGYSNEETNVKKFQAIKINDLTFD